MGAFLRLLTEIHHLVCTVETAHESVCRSWPVTVGVTPMSVVTVVTLHMQQRTEVFMVKKASWLELKSTEDEVNVNQMRALLCKSVKMTKLSHRQEKYGTRLFPDPENCFVIRNAADC